MGSRNLLLFVASYPTESSGKTCGALDFGLGGEAFPFGPRNASC